MTSNQSYKPREKKHIFKHFNLSTMKRNLLFMSVLVSLFLAGCSQEEIAPNGEDNGNGEANTSYMAVNLVSSDVPLKVTRMEVKLKTMLPRSVSISSTGSVVPSTLNFKTAVM